MTEEQFCKNDSAFDGEQVDNIKQIAFRSFNGEELKEYVEHHISLVQNGELSDVSDQRVLFDFKNWWNELPDESDDRLFITKGTIERFLKSNSR